MIKSIKVRYTKNNWNNNSFKDVPLIYIATNEYGSDELLETNLMLNENTTDEF